jgi:hypothetical protein
MASTKERHLESLPVNPARWYDISWWSLIIFGSIAAIAAIGTVVSTLIQFWSGGILDRHTEWRTASLELETAKAREHSAELEKEIIQAQSALDTERVKRALLQRSLSARNLAERQKESLVDAWHAFAGRKVSVFAYLSSPESISLAKQIIECMQGAGLVVDDQTKSNAQLGVFVPHILVGGPDEALVKIIANALVSIGLEASIGSPPPTGLAEFEASDASIFVGVKSLPIIQDPTATAP